MRGGLSANSLAAGKPPGLRSGRAGDGGLTPAHPLARAMMGRPRGGNLMLFRRTNRREFIAGLEVQQRDAARWLDYFWFNFASLGADTGRH